MRCVLLPGAQQTARACEDENYVAFMALRGVSLIRTGLNLRVRMTRHRDAAKSAFYAASASADPSGAGDEDIRGSSRIAATRVSMAVLTLSGMLRRDG